MRLSADPITYQGWRGNQRSSPAFAARIDLEVKDAWGLPAVRITFENHPDDIATMKWLLEREREIFDAMGAKRFWPRPVEDFSTSRHPMGTCRMGLDRAKSVVNQFGQTHDVRNLFVVSSPSQQRPANQHHRRPALLQEFVVELLQPEGRTHLLLVVFT